MNDILSAINVALGMKGTANASGAASAVFPDDGVSFGDVLGQAVNTADEAVQAEAAAKEEALDEEDFSESEKVTFAELTQQLADKIGNADENVISAAIQLVMSVGRVVEKLFGMSNDAVYDPDKSYGSVMQIFGILVDKIPETSEEDYEIIIPDELMTAFPEENAEAEELIEELADVIDEGFAEDKGSDEIVRAINDILSDGGDKKKTAMADAVAAVLCALSGMDVRTENFDVRTAVNGISPEAVNRLSQMARAISSDMPAAQKNEAVIRLAVSAVIEEDPVKFADFIQKPEKLSFGHMNITKSMAYSLRINNAAAQADEINVAKNPAAAASAGVPVLTADETPVTEVQVFKELGEFVNVQLAESISDEIGAPEEFEGVKELTVVLRPKELGEVAVRIASDKEGKLSLIFSAANAEVGRAISENAAALSADLSKQNIEVKDINVVNPSEASAYMGLDFTNQGFSRRDYDGSGSGSGSYGGQRNAVSGAGSVTEAADAVRAAELLKEVKLWALA